MRPKLKYKESNLKRDLMFAEAAYKAKGPDPINPNFKRDRSKRKAERKRQRMDKGLNWNWVKDLLDNDYTLTQAKQIVKDIQRRK
jgi:hypothetical protein